MFPMIERDRTVIPRTSPNCLTILYPSSVNAVVTNACSTMAASLQLDRFDALLELGEIDVLLRSVPVERDTDDFIVLDDEVGAAADILACGIIDPERLGSADRRFTRGFRFILSLVLRPDLINCEALCSKDVDMDAAIEPVGTEFLHVVLVPFGRRGDHEIIRILHREIGRGIERFQIGRRLPYVRLLGDDNRDLERAEHCVEDSGMRLILLAVTLKIELVHAGVSRYEDLMAVDVRLCRSLNLIGYLRSLPPGDRHRLIGAKLEVRLLH